MRVLLPSSIALLATLAALPAQVSTTAQLISGTVQSGAAAAAMPVGGSIGNSLVQYCSSASGTANFAAGQSGTLTYLDLGWSVGCQANWMGTTVADATIRYGFSSPTPFTGHLVVTWTPTASGTGSSLLEVDLGADGTIDSNGATVLPVTCGPNTALVQVRVRCQAAAGWVSGPFGSGWSYQGAANGILSMRLEPTHCQSQVAGTACGIPQFTAAGTFLRGVELRGGVQPGAEIAILALGFAPAALPISLPPNCTMQLDAAILVWQFTYGAPQALWTLSVPSPLLPVTFRAQHLGLDLDTMNVFGSPSLSLAWQ